MKKRTLVPLLAVAAALAAAGTATAVAADRSRGPETEQVAAVFSFAPVKLKQRQCLGQDGPYLEIKAKYRGSVTGDARVAGAIEVEAHHLIDAAEGLGTSEGTFSIREAGTDELKARGRFYGVFTELVNFHGFAVGKIVGEGTWLAHFGSVVDPATGSVAGQFGGVGDPRTPSVVQRGTCTGRWETIVGGSSR